MLALELTVGSAMLALVAFQAVVMLAYRSAWVQRHEGVKKLLEEEQKVGEFFKGVLQHGIDNHEDGQQVRDLAKSYASKKGMDQVLAQVLESPKA